LLEKPNNDRNIAVTRSFLYGFIFVTTFRIKNNHWEIKFQTIVELEKGRAIQTHLRKASPEPPSTKLLSETFSSLKFEKGVYYSLNLMVEISPRASLMNQHFKMRSDIKVDTWF
jgi:hypothetical protein